MRVCPRLAVRGCVGFLLFVSVFPLRLSTLARIPRIDSIVLFPLGSCSVTACAAMLSSTMARHSRVP